MQYIFKFLKGSMNNELWWIWWTICATRIKRKVKEEFEKSKNDDNFKKQYLYYLNQYVGRPSPLYFAKNLSDYSKGAKIYLKREDLNHTGSHKINNALGQILLAKRMNKTHIIAETGAGSHGTAVATVCSLFNMKCSIFMGKEDIKRQMPNVERMKILGAEVIEVKEGKGTLKEAVDAAFNYLLENQDVFYLVGSCVGPSPYPKMVKYFQKIIGEEAKEQILNQEGKLPKAIIACIGGGSNSIGLFTDFIKEKNVDIYGIEAAGKGLNTNQHASAIYNNKIGVLHGMKTYIMQDENGDIREAYSISAGLDYPGIGPEHAYLKSIGRVKYDSITDKEAIESFKLLCRLEGIIPALESSHAIAYAVKIAKNYSKDDSIIVNLSGRGDKDLFTILNI